MGKEGHYSNKGGHFLRGQAMRLERDATRLSFEGRFIKPNEPPRFTEMHDARRNMRRAPQSGRRTRQQS